MSHFETVQILLVEDSPGDVRLTQEVMKEATIPNRLHVAEDGEQALRFLRREQPYADAPRPDLVLLDLNMPRKDGREVLAEMKNDPELRSIPVIVLTTSAAQTDVARSYELAVNAFITKPIDLGDFIEVVRQIERFWLATVRLPAS